MDTRVLCSWNRSEELVFFPDGEHLNSVLSHENRIALRGPCGLFDEWEQHMVKKTRSNCKFYAASVGFRSSCLRQWPLTTVLLVSCVTSGYVLLSLFWTSISGLFLSNSSSLKFVLISGSGSSHVSQSRLTFMVGWLPKCEHGLRPLHRAFHALCGLYFPTKHTLMQLLDPYPQNQAGLC